MVAKNRKYAVDEPREVGVLFTLIGLYGITIAILIVAGLGAVAILVMSILLSSIESSNKPKSQKR